MATSMYRHPRGGGGGNRSFNRSSPAAQGFRRNNNNRSYNIFPPGKFNFSDIRGRGMPDYHIRPRNMGNKAITPSEDVIVKETANVNGVNQRHAPIIGENKAVSPSEVVTVKEIANEIGHAPIAGENKAVSPSGVSKEPIARENGTVAAHLQNGNSTEFSKSNEYTQPPPVTKLINGTMENGIPSVKSDTTITPVKGILVHLNKEDSATQVIGNNGDNVGSKKKSVRFVETEEDMAEEVKFLADAFREFSNALGILAGKLVTRYGNK